MLRATVNAQLAAALHYSCDADVKFAARSVISRFDRESNSWSRPPHNRGNKSPSSPSSLIPPKWEIQGPGANKPPGATHGALCPIQDLDCKLTGLSQCRLLLLLSTAF